MAKAHATPPAIPSHTKIKPLLLALLTRKGELSLPDAIESIAKKFSLSKAQRAKHQPCGKETVLQNRVRWARWELQRDGKVRTTRRGFFDLA